jgi:uncharacterized protein
MKPSSNAWQKFVNFPITRIILALFIVIVPVLIEQLIVTSLPIDRLWKNVLLGILTLPVVYWTYYAYVRSFEKRTLIELASAGALKEVAQGVVVGALLFSGTIGILALLGVYNVTGTNNLDVIIIPLIGSVISGFFEEVLFRGILFRIIEESLGSWLALLISALIFGSLHLMNENATLIGALSVMFEAGILLAAAYMLTQRLWFAIGIHFAWNFTQSGIFGIAVSGNEPLKGILQSSLSGPDWLSGGQFGAEASIVAVILCVGAGVYFTWRAIRKGNLIQPYWKRTNS